MHKLHTTALLDWRPTLVPSITLKKSNCTWVGGMPLLPYIPTIASLGTERLNFTEPGVFCSKWFIQNVPGEHVTPNFQLATSRQWNQQKKKKKRTIYTKDYTFYTHLGSDISDIMYVRKMDRETEREGGMEEGRVGGSKRGRCETERKRERGRDSNRGWDRQRRRWERKRQQRGICCTCFFVTAPAVNDMCNRGKLQTKFSRKVQLTNSSIKLQQANCVENYSK